VIDCERAHEAVHAIKAIIENLFLHRRGGHVAPSDVNLGPLNAGWSGGTLRSRCVIDPKRFDATDISILVLHHCPVRERVSVITRGFRYRTGGRKIRRLRHVNWSDECRISRDRIVRMERVHFPGVIVDLRCRDHVIRCARRRRCAAVVAGQQTEAAGICVDNNAPERCSIYQIVNVEGVGTGLFVGRAAAGRIVALEHIGRHVESIGPNSDFRIICEPRMRGIIGSDRVKPPATAHRIARL